VEELSALDGAARGALVLRRATEEARTPFDLAAGPLFRARLLQWMQGNPQAPAIDTLVGEIATTVEALEPHAVGKVELRGTSWSARNS